MIPQPDDPSTRPWVDDAKEEGSTCATGPHPRPGGHPLRRRLRRRDAADRRPVHRRLGDVRQRHLDPAELPRRDPRPRRHPARRLQLPAALRQLRHHDPGRPAGRAGGDEPGRAQGQHRRPGPGRGDHRRHRRLHQAQPGQGRLRGEPARGRLADRLPAARPRPDRDDRRGRQGVRPDPQGRLPREEHVRPRSAVLAVRPPDRGHRSTSSPASSPASRRSATPTSPPSRPGTPSARPPRPSPSPTRCAPAPMPAGAVPADLRQPRAGVRADHRARARPACRCSSVPTRSPRPPTCCTS